MVQANRPYRAASSIAGEPPKRSWIKAVVLTAFPSPRRPVALQHTWPIVAFLILFAGACLLLSVTAINLGVFRIPELFFVSPWSFVLLLLAPWFWWMIAAGHSGLTGARAQTALWLRFILLGMMIVLIAEPRLEQTNRQLSIVFLLDVSESMTAPARQQALRYVAQTAATKPSRDQIGVVVFGRDAAVEQLPTISPPATDVFESVATQVKIDGTNLAEGLSLASAMIRDDTQGRIVLISDGVSTEGDVASTVDQLKSRGVIVDVLPFQYEYDREVWITRLELPRIVKYGETYEAAAIVHSLSDVKDATLILEENGQKIVEVATSLSPGANRIAVPIHLREPGYYEYSATIRTPEGADRVTANNSAQSYLYLEGEGKVLVVYDATLDYEEAKKDFDDLVEALRQDKRDVKVLASSEIPRDALGLLPYDCLIIPNVGREAFEDPQLQAIHDAVRNQGMGLLMVGGGNSFGPGGYHNTPIEKALPVDMDIKNRKVLPKGALAIILHTCEFDAGNSMAKRIAKQAIEVLNDGDDAGVLAYDWGNDKWIVPMMPVREYQSTMLPLLEKGTATIGDMPAFSPTMQMALAALRRNNASAKHMIIISDGDPSMPPPALLQQFIDNSITISTVAVQPHGNNILPRIAATTGGQYYLAQPAQLPAIFIKEAKKLTRSMIQEKKEGFAPQVTFPSPIVKGIDRMPKLYGYVITTLKPTPSIRVLTVPETEDDDPLLARWHYGLGKSAAFTADLSSRWGADWLRWDQYKAFVMQLVTDIARVRKVGSLRIQTFSAGSQGVIVVEDFAPQASFLTIEAQVNGPDAKQMQLSMEQTGPNRYEGRFPLWGVGRYQVTAAALRKGQTPNEAQPDGENNAEPETNGDQVERVHAGFALSYSQEFMRFHADPVTLSHVAQASGGRQLTGEAETDKVYDVERTARRSTAPLADAPPIWMFLTFLLLMDVATRRVHIDWSIVAGWFSTRKVDSETMMSALQRRKQAVSATMARTPFAKTPSLKPTAPQKAAMDDIALPDPKAAAPQGAPKKTSDQQTTTSTTERLLAIKRKQNQPPTPEAPPSAPPPTTDSKD